MDTECAQDLCRGLTGVPVRFQDTSSGSVQSRLWEFGLTAFGNPRNSTRREETHTWSAPGFYTVTLTVSNGDVQSTASRTFLVEASEPAGTCEADAETLCLQDSRYAVRIDWWNLNGEQGAGLVVHAGTNDSGLFTFFGPENWEVLVKVLDGCWFNDHHWVFAASATDVGFDLVVRDTQQAAAIRQYTKSPGEPAVAVTDIGAFPESCRP